MQASNDSPDLAEQAAEWMVLLTCDDPVERARGEAGFRAWKAADARHAEAAARIEQFVAQVRGVRLATAGNPRPARAALDAAHEGKRQRRRTALRAGAAPRWLRCQAAIRAIRPGGPARLRLPLVSKPTTYGRSDVTLFCKWLRKEARR